MAFTPWWDAWPGRLDAEREAFTRRGWNFSLDQVEWEAGRVVLRGQAPISQTEWAELVVVYPDTFPHARIAIFAPSLRLARHQNPLQTNLCALPNASDFWRPSMLAAQVVETQVPDVVRLARSDDPARSDVEYPQGEPASAYYPYVPLGGFLIPEEAFELPVSAQRGSLRVRFDPDDAWLTETVNEIPEDPLLGVGALIEVTNHRSEIIATDNGLAGRFVGEEWTGRWVQLEEAPMTLDLSELMSTLVRADRRLSQRTWGDHGGRQLELIGVSFPEEVRQGSWETGWFFLVLHRDSNVDISARFIRGMRYSSSHLAERIDELTNLRNKSVSIVGVGALGAPICFDLARSLVGEIRPMDHDYFDPSTSVRWPAGVRAAGSNKTLYLKAEIGAQYPLTTVTPFSHMIGTAPLEREEAEGMVLEAWLENADLLIDASAENNVSRVLSHLANPNGLPQVYVWSVEGFGGIVARVQPGRTGCYLCLERALSEGRIPSPDVPDVIRRVQPRGCSDPTFVAPYVDLAPLSLEAVRFAIAELSNYPSSTYDVLTFFIRNRDGSVRSPGWETSQLPSYDDCLLCRAAA